jgi:uncharacterized phage protein gp47/JayE
MNLPVRDFDTIVRDMSAAITASAGRLIDMSVGSVLRALIEANAAVMLWVQWLILLTLQTTRAATSTGADLDSWMADFSLLRIPAISATGTATFSRFSGSTVAFIPTDTVVKTQDGSFSFSVVADSSNLAWQAALSAYCLAIGVMAIDLPIMATTAGVSGNVLPDTITLLASAVPGIDAINNQAATYGGLNAEADNSLRLRFAGFFAARSRATSEAIGYAISLVGSGLKYVIQENVDASGRFTPGSILITVDDGSGILSDLLFNSLSLAVAAVRPVGTAFSIQPPQLINVQVSLVLQCPAELAVSAVQSRLQSAIGSYINARAIGGTLSVTRISQLIYRTEPMILNVSDILLNGLSSDLTIQPTASFRYSGVNFA